jgi:polyisoprenoid-binding protein YceI
MSPSGQLTSSALQALREGRVAGSWTLDASRSRVRLKTRHTWGLRPLHGVFHEVTGNGTVSPSGDVTGSITVAARSIDTRNKTRDKHLRSAAFFDVANYPDITFTAEQIRSSGDAVTVAGRLQVRNRSLPASFDAAVSGFDGDEVDLAGELRVNRADFGLTWNMLGMAGMHNTIVVHAVFTRQ